MAMVGIGDIFYFDWIYRKLEYSVVDINDLELLRIAVRYSRDNMIYHLLEMGADPNFPSDSGQTPFHSFCYGQSIANGYFDKTLTAFLEHGAKADYTNRCGQTPLDYALFYCQRGELVNRLILLKLDSYLATIGPPKLKSFRD